MVTGMLMESHICKPSTVQKMCGWTMFILITCILHIDQVWCITVLIHHDYCDLYYFILFYFIVLFYFISFLSFHFISFHFISFQFIWFDFIYFEISSIKTQWRWIKSWKIWYPTVHILIHSVLFRQKTRKEIVEIRVNRPLKASQLDAFCHRP